MVDLTSAAIAEIKRLQLNQQSPDVALRLTVKPGGCLDFFYNLSFESPTSSNELNSEKSDRLIEIDGIRLVIDPQSWSYTADLRLDYAEDLMGGGFRFHNPQHLKTCGCGISFIPKSE